jgi:IS4 transposase
MPGTATDLFQDPLFLAFAKARPIAVVAQMALRHLLDDQALQQVFQENAHAQREVNIPFPALTQMMASVVLGQEPSVNASIKKTFDALRASHQAVYGKLQRLETGISRGLVTYSFQRTLALQQQFGSVRRHDIAGYETRILDGNHLAATDHRLKETRNSTAAPLPGKTLVVYSPRHDAIVDCFPIEDGHAQERSALDEVLTTVGKRQLWVADRNFCTLKFLYGIAAAGSGFIVRQHGQLTGQPVGKLRKIGTTETGVVYEQKFQLPEHNGSSLMIRRIVVELNQPTRDGDRQVFLLTNLPREQADALKISEEYLKRWRIETVMQVLTEALRCEIKPLCYPKAALFGFAISLVMYNALSIVRSAIQAEKGRDTSESLSHYYLALEIAQASDGMLVILPPSRWVGLREVPPDQLAQAMMRVVRNIDCTYYCKSPRGPKKPKRKPKHARRKVHVSTKKLLDLRRE